MIDDIDDYDRNANRRVIHATCVQHGGAQGYTNLVVTKKNGEIELDPHAAGVCVVRLDENAARVLSAALTGWLG
ncbi:MAG TPA: hypothetical protein VJT72_01495 [Pseudonocardiaceae bacterium]|nr:hypothetical protein [Pseudonocardiaceae bacterium]